MRFEYTHSTERDEGFDHEKGDCTVFALKHATGVPYRDAHQFLARAGRMDRRGMPMSLALLGWEARKDIVYGYRVFQVPIPPRLTLGRLMPVMQEGRYIVGIKGHVFAVVDGVVHDTARVGPRSRVLSIWRFEPSSQVEAREAAQAVQKAV
jgi:hypothetical protein